MPRADQYFQAILRIRRIRIISLDSEPYQSLAGSGSVPVSNDTDPDPTKTIENRKQVYFFNLI